ncbi:AraC family transcriptional regulator [Bradyrhizobium sp. 41S5]|uniref:helix-turn-helix transcriptional regulator n=1 Tax=Bradyrhizobium sp. 41S5 TaxID=1404443 RepID=UPI00156B9687|nr:AraC family transcriptional regulator [Bradyrhizobium sp. 41S5]UFX48268.1 AraC family transcriptional regulator [Bradyrhizobium sp. 41S5]
MHKWLDIDFRAIQSELRGRDFVRSSEILGPTESLFKTKEHGYRRIDDAIFLHVMDFEIGRPYSLQMARPEFICIQIAVSGTYNRSIGDHVDVVKPASIHISNAPLSVSDTRAGTKLCGVLIACNREYFVDHFKLNVDRVPEAYRPIFSSRIGSPSSLMLPAKPDIMLAADQILSCRYHEPLRHFYLNAKVVEIICGIAAQINGLPAQMPLRAVPNKRAVIEAAAMIYRRETFNPPTIAQLATRVGLNRNDITSGFREAFGMTPHAYGHLLRMEKAHLMLQDGQLSVSDVARRVGYEGYSSFCRAYRSHFGRSPSIVKPKPGR